MQPEIQYKKIQIQQLEQRPQFQGNIPTKTDLLQQIDKNLQFTSKPLMCYIDSGISKNRIIKRNGLFKVSHFFQAFLSAYTQHGDIVLVPDQIWIMISFYLSKYIDKHAKQLRLQLVRHQDVKTLTIEQMCADVKYSIAAQKNWDYFFDEIIKMIQKQTVQGVVEDLACNFSTTNKVYKTISTALIMNSLKHFFKYQRMLAGCGINNVYMAGVRQDWASMIPKLEKLEKFDVDGQLKKYIKHMKVILQNFLLTFDQKPDKKWWDLIMKDYKSFEVYGGQQQKVNGWILHFYGMYEETQLDSLPQFAIKVPIKLINTFTKKQKDMILMSEWTSVSKLDSKAYKPDVGMFIICNQTKNLGQQKSQKKETKKIGLQKPLKTQKKEIKKIGLQKPSITQKIETKKLGKQKLQNKEKKTKQEKQIIEKTQLKPKITSIMYPQKSKQQIQKKPAVPKNKMFVKKDKK